MTRRIWWAILLTMALVAIGFACEQSVSGSRWGKGPASPAPPLPAPSADSQKPAGPVEKGMIILPNGRMITPMGKQLKPLSFFPNNLKATPDQKFLVILCDGRHRQNHLQTVKIPELTLVSSFVHERKLAFYYGLVVIDAPPALSAAYRYVVLAGGGPDERTETDPFGQTVIVPGKVYVFGMSDTGVLTELAPIEVDRGAFVGALVLDQDEADLDRALLYVAYAYQSKVAAVSVNFSDLSSVVVTHSISVVKYPYDLVLSADKKTLYVSNWGTKRLSDLPKVSVVDVTDADSVSASPGISLAREITVGKNPEGMVLSPDGKKLYVADSETDDIAVINTQTNFAEDFISLRAHPNDAYGVKPTALSISADGKILLVASSGRNSLDLIELSSKKFLGSVPTAWYPTAALEAGGFWYVINGKGEGGGPDPVKDCWETMPGSLSQIPTNTSSVYLSALTMLVEWNNNRQLTYFEIPPEEPLRQLPIKHVIYILKENKTYDQEMGDYAKGNGDPAHCIYCCNKTYGKYCYTPNLHALADRFVNLDNFYCDSEASITGHMWNASANISDYVEKAYLDNYRTGVWLLAAGIEATSYTKAGFIFNHLKRAGLPFRNYGEMVGSIDPETGRQFDGVVIDPRWPLTFDLSIPDKDKIQVFLDNLAKGDFPSFIFMLLPNDHTAGCSTGAWHPDSLVSDNDEAMGRVVDAVSHSKFWKDTLIFVTEDDPQGGADHVDNHRTIGLVIGPWVKKGVTVSTHYSWPNFYRTLEVFLGLPPMSTYDDLGTPMYDVFDTAPHYEPYTYIPQETPMEKVNQPGGLLSCPRAAITMSDKADFSAPDQVPELGRILWMTRHPKKPFPAAMAGKDSDD